MKTIFLSRLIPLYILIISYFFTIQGRYVSWLYRLDLATDELTVIKDSDGDEYVVSEIVTVYEDKLHFVADGKLLTLDGNNQIRQITSDPIETEIRDLGRLFSPGKAMPRVDDKLFIHSYNTPLEFLVLEKGEQQTRQLDHYYPGLDENNFDYFLPLWADDSGLWFAATNTDNQSGIWQLDKASGEYQFLEAVENVERLIFLKSSDSGFYYHGAAYLHGLMEFSISSGQSRRVGYVSIAYGNTIDGSFYTSENLLIDGDDVYFAGGIELYDDGENILPRTDSLWKTSLNNLDSEQVVESVTMNSSSAPSEFTKIDDVTYFTASSESSDRPIWKFNETTDALSRLVETEDSQFGTFSYATNLMVIGKKLFFIARDSDDLVQLWEKDTVSGSLTRISDFPEFNNDGLKFQSIRSIGKVKGQVYFFTAFSTQVGVRVESSELWVFDPDSRTLEQKAELDYYIYDAFYSDEVILVSGFDSNSDGLLEAIDPVSFEIETVSEKRRHFYRAPTWFNGNDNQVYFKTTVSYSLFSAETIFVFDKTTRVIRRIFSPEDIDGQNVWRIDADNRSVLFATADSKLWAFDIATDSMEELVEGVSANLAITTDYIFFTPFSESSLKVMARGTNEISEFNINKLSDASLAIDNRLKLIGNSLYVSAFVQQRSTYLGSELAIIDLSPLTVVEVDYPQSVNEGAMVTLDASDSFDKYGAPFNYSWSQNSGFPDDLQDRQEPVVAFKAPGVNKTEEMEIWLHIDKQGERYSQRMLITINDINQQPALVFTASSEQVAGGESVTLTADVTDSDSDSIDYRWLQLAGRTSLEMSQSEGAFTFTAPSSSTADVYEFSVTISDGIHEVTQTLSVNVAAKTPEPQPSGASGGGGSLFWLTCLLFCGFGARVYRRHGRV